MPEITLEVVGYDDVMRRLGKLPKVVNDEMKKGILDSARVIAIEARDLIQNSKPTGELQSDGTRASAPGDPPANRTGALIRTIKAYPGKGISAIVASNDAGAAALEYGRKGAEARPFIRAAATKSYQQVMGYLNLAFRRGIEKATRA